MNYLLLIDTSTDIGSVALAADGAVTAVSYNEETRNHAAAINNMTANVMAAGNISLSDLNAVAVCAGPGSYTGLRIGMATAKGLCYALDIPLIASDRLELLARPACRRHEERYSQYVTLLVAREKEYFIGVYDANMKTIHPPQHIAHDELIKFIDIKSPTYFITNADESAITDLKISDFVVGKDIKIEINAWGEQAFEKYICNEIVNLQLAEPLYLKQVYTHK